MDDEDTHFCLRCRATIQGLENYIIHRQQKCQSASYITKPTDPLPSSTPTHSSYLSMTRGGPSASSSSSLRSYLYIPPKSLSDPILSSSSNAMEDRYKSRHGNEHPLVADLSVENASDDFMSHLGLCMANSTNWASDIHSEEPLRADDFFSLLELQSCKGAESSRQRPRRSIEPVTSERSKSEVESLQTDDQNDATFPLVETADLKSSHGSAVSELANAEDVTDTSGLLITSDVTGAFSSPEMATGAVIPCTEMEINSSTELSADTTTEDADGQTIPVSPEEIKLPYPSRGKWMPGLKPRVIHKAGSLVEYHCKPCNRRLTGRVVFEKHLQSELHFKRTAQQLGTGDGPKYGLRRKKDNAASAEVDARPSLLQNDVLEDDEEVDDPWRVNKRKKKGVRNVQRCPTCSVWVPKPLFGKHLVSRYHLSRCHKHPDRDRCILDHIHLIVLEAPFQCRLCRFYCHSHADLLTHWKSAAHSECDLQDSARRSDGSYFCSLCHIGEMDCEAMRIHLESERHLSCVDIVNKSVAVVVSKLDYIKCHLCGDQNNSINFRYRIALNQHLASEHSVPSGALTQHTSRVYACDHCDFKTSSNWSFTHHRFNCQATPSNETRYRCLVCNLGFPTKEEVTRHRSTQEHRDVATRQRGSYGTSVRSRSCPHCYRTFTDLAVMKEHFFAEHPDLLPRCIRCGATFALKQQLSAHRRAGCQETKSSESLAQGCDRCSYRCRLKVDLLFHQAVEHPKKGDPRTGMSGASAVKYRCPECDQLYGSTAALKVHLKSHTGELAFRCQHCGRHFEREEERLAHIRQLHAPRPNIKGQSMTAPEATAEKRRKTHSTSRSRDGVLVHLDA